MTTSFHIFQPPCVSNYSILMLKVIVLLKNNSSPTQGRINIAKCGWRKTFYHSLTTQVKVWPQMSSTSFIAQKSNYIFLVHSFYYLPRGLFHIFSLQTPLSFGFLFHYENWSHQRTSTNFPYSSSSLTSICVHTLNLLFYYYTRIIHAPI